MKKVICSLCHGRGGDVIITCSNCNGSGYDPQDDNPFAQCHTCYGIAGCSSALILGMLTSTTR
ncbi:TPA: hypothetical protein MG836_19235 [Klebsiella pneumoniae]|nr:hypothetical protein BB788_27415 [Klebsiella pneumoniae]KAB7746950.1 hypothetical protein GB874_21355 [Klebsiella pneumoniae]MBK2874093.1 hypothetical protein [Klebsiella pneumoniae]MBK2883862.1 hypothetical protein [Klebsiella pneumoniae]MBK2894376.1 hypothetical protein [Klebsiella pneumoniae]